MSINIEEVFQLLQQNKWEELLEFERENQKEIINTPLVKKVFDDYFIDALIHDLENKKDDIYGYLILKRVYQRFIHHRNITYDISDEKFQKVVIKYLKCLYSQKEFKLAYKIANDWSTLEYAKELINHYNKTQPKIVEHSTDDKVRVSINPDIQKINHTISLFKSKQEYEFFMLLENIIQIILLIQMLHLAV